MKKRLTATLLAAVLAAGVFAGCGTAASQPASDSNEPGVHANEITVGLANDLDNTLDPHKTTKAGTREVMFNVFEGLLKPTPNGDLAPALAQDYQVSEDRLTYTFTLRDSVQYHNGDTVKASDVVWSFERCIHPEDPEIRPDDALEVIEKVEAVDDKTVVFTLSKPDVDFLTSMTLAVIPENYDQQGTAPVGTGPFKFVSREAQDTVVLEKFENYWGEPAYLDKVTLKIMENADSMVLSLQSKAIDLCNHLPTEQAAQLEKNFDIVEGSMSLVQALYLNNAVAPFDNEQVRKALCYATDRQQVLDVAFDGYGSLVGSSMYPALGKYFDESLTGSYEYDPEKAKQLLKEAGFANGFDMTITVPSNYPQHVATAQVLAEQYKAIGVNVELKLVEWNSWVEDAYMGRNYQATVVGLDASNMTARAMLNRFETGHRKNFTNYSSETFDEYYNAALNAADDAQQVEMYKKAQRDLAEHAANVYIQAPADLVAMRKGLVGMQFYPLYILDLSSIRWAE